MLAACKVKMSVSEKKKRTGTQAKNFFVKTNDIFSPLLLETFGHLVIWCHYLQRGKILLDYKSERNLTEHCLESIRFTVLRGKAVSC